MPDIDHYRNVSTSLLAAADDDPESPLYTLLVHAANTMNEVLDMWTESRTIVIRDSENDNVLATIVPPESDYVFDMAVGEYIRGALERASRLDEPFNKP
jgi:hypothetical protein